MEVAPIGRCNMRLAQRLCALISYRPPQNDSMKQEDRKDALINLVRERDEFELRVKDLQARNHWLEKQVLGSSNAFR